LPIFLHFHATADIFVSFGLSAPSHATALTVLFVGACAVSIAIFLVIEL